MTLNDRLAEFFKAHPNEWIDGMVLAKIAGQYAWSARIRDLRKPELGYRMTIENKLVHHRTAISKWTQSFYRYVPEGARADEAPTDAADLNGWSLQ